MARVLLERFALVRTRDRVALKAIAAVEAAAIALSLFFPATSLGRTIFVSPDGSDDAPGTAGRPLRTISRAAERAMPGDVVLVRAGIYRERVAPPRGGQPGMPITYRGEKLGTVFIRGSDEWRPDWNRHARTVFVAPLDDAKFVDDVYRDSANPFHVELASTPYGRDGKPEVERFDRGDPSLSFTCGQLIVDGEPWTQRPFLSEVESEPETWAFVSRSDGGSDRIYANFGGRDPTRSAIEITTRRRVFAPHVLGLGHIVIEGFVLEHCGNQYPTNFWRTPEWAQAGALGLRGGHHWIVRQNVIRYANTVALDMGAGGGDNERESRRESGGHLGRSNVIEQNYIVDNGSAGIVGAESSSLIVRKNVILRNNTLRFGGPKRWEHAGIKCHGVRDGLIEQNYVADNPGSDGIWLDNQFPGTRVTRNVVVNNGARGIFLEMSDYKFDAALIDHNLSIGNRGAQFYVHDASGATVMHNLFANSPADAKYGQGVYIYQVSARTRTGHHSLYNNLFVRHKVMLDINYPAHRSGPQRLDHNVYDAADGERSFVVNSASDKPSPWEPEEFLTLVQRDVGHEGPSPLSGGRKVALTLDEWRNFWSKHGETNDRGSIALKGMTVTYEPATLELTVNLPFDPRAVGSTSHPRIDRDFSGQPVPRDGKATPGPFQSAARGANRFRVWDGLPLLDAGELPPD